MATSVTAANSAKTAAETAAANAAASATAAAASANSLNAAAFITALLTAMDNASFKTKLLTVIKEYTGNDEVITASDLGGDSAGSFNNDNVRDKFATLPIAQFKHLPDLSALGQYGGGGIYSLNDEYVNKKKSKSKSPKISIKRSKTIKK